MLRTQLLALIGVVAFLLFLLVRLPIDTVLSLSGIDKQISYARVEGDLAHLVLYDVSLESFKANKLELVPSWGALLFGKVEGHARFEGSDGLYGRFNYFGSEIYSLNDVVVQSEVDLVFGNARTKSMVVFEGKHIEIDNLGRCVSGALDMRTNAIAELLIPLDLEGPLLMGDVSCVNGQFGVAVSGLTDAIEIEGGGKLSASGRLPIDVSVKLKSKGSVAEDLQSLMEFAGFTQTGGHWRGTINLELFK